MSMDTLQEKIRQMKNPSVLSLAPGPDSIPPALREIGLAKYGKTYRGLAEGCRLFCLGLIDALCSQMPAVILHTAFFAQYGSAGFAVLEEVSAAAQRSGMYVIMDPRCGDESEAATAWASTYLGSEQPDSLPSPYSCDAVTINGYYGTDGLRPFTSIAKAADKAVFLIIRTANGSTRELQDLITGDRQVYTAMADLAVRLTNQGQLVSGDGWSTIGLIAGMNRPGALQDLRTRYPSMFLLIPNYGVSGCRAKDCAGAFDRFGHGAAVCSPRSLQDAWKTALEGTDFADAAQKAADKMLRDLQRFTQVL